MRWFDWLIVVIPFSAVIWMAFRSRRYVRGVSDFLAGGRVRFQSMDMSKTVLKNKTPLNPK